MTPETWPTCVRLGRLAESWIAPPEHRELRELVRFRAKLSNLRTGLTARVHAVMAKNGVLPARNHMWGIGGAAQLDGLELGQQLAGPGSSLHPRPLGGRQPLEALTQRAFALGRPVSPLAKPVAFAEGGVLGLVETAAPLREGWL